MKNILSYTRRVLSVVIVVMAVIGIGFVTPKSHAADIINHVTVLSYEDDVNYMQLMYDAAKSGERPRIQLAAVYEVQRNIKIDNEELDAEKTDFFINYNKPEDIQYQVELYLGIIVEEPEPVQKLVGNFTITYYCPCSKCCGKWGGKATASGTKPTSNRTIAADWSVIPSGTQVYIEGLGYRTVEDKGGGVKGRHIDVFMDSHSECLKMGRHKANVYIVE